jgi:hypothetical protein
MIEKLEYEEGVLIPASELVAKINEMIDVMNDFYIKPGEEG